jgi:hypothetical protein
MMCSGRIGVGSLLYLTIMGCDFVLANFVMLV